MIVWDDYVVDRGNEAAVRRIVEIAEGLKPGNLIVRGDKGSGKTAMLQAAGKAFGSQGSESEGGPTALFTHAAELATAVQLNTNTKLLDRAGSVKLLFIDSIEDFMANEIGADLCTLLLKERGRQHLDTIVGSQRSAKDFDEEWIHGAFGSFEDISIEPLSDNGRIELAQREFSKWQRDEASSPTITENALAFVAVEFAKDIAEIRHAIRFLATSAGFEKGDVIDAEVARRVFEA